MSERLMWAVGGIWGMLALASVIVFLLVRLRPQKDYSELARRTKSWWFMIAIFTAAMLTSRTVSFFFLGFTSFLALKEFFSMVPTRRTDRRVLFWAYLAIPAQYYFAAVGWYGMFIIFIPVYMFLLVAARTVLTQETVGFLKSVGIIHWGLMVTVFAISHTAYLVALPPIHDGQVTGPGLLLYLIALTQFNDVAQYTWGKLFGKRPILPRVSPKKTWEGFLGGVISTTALAALAAPLVTPFSLPFAILSGLLLSVAGFMGDVTISAVKRDIGVKDTGSLIPGHGGVMDRIDSLTFAAPLFFHFTYYFYY